MNFSISTLCFSTLLAAALSSCTNEIQSLMDADRAVTFTTATPHRATGTTWEAGDAIGVFMAASGETVGTDAAVRYETPSPSPKAVQHKTSWPTTPTTPP